MAFAATGMAHYLHGGLERPSPQFLYHQCKMIDQWPGESGTDLISSIRVLSNHSVVSYGELDWGYSDAGSVRESDWPYSNSEGMNEAHSPPPSHLRGKIYRGRRLGNLSGEVVRTSPPSEAMVEEIRALIANLHVPVLVGVDLFVSINNPHTRMTGEVFVPLDDEPIWDGHAMMIVGFDDRDERFVVRNSWGTDWAFENPLGLPGHALMPYLYFVRHAERSYAIHYMSEIKVDIAEDARLYNVGAATLGKRKPRPAQRKRGRVRRVPKKQKSLLRRLFG